MKYIFKTNLGKAARFAAVGIVLFSLLFFFSDVLNLFKIQPALAAVVYDAFSNVAAGTGNLTWTHTPVGTPKGIIVFIVQSGSGADQVSSVTYGGVAMTEVSGSPNLHATGETGAVYAYFLGSGIPTGARTVSVTVSGSATKLASAVSLTAGGDTIIVVSNGTIKSDSLANPSVTLPLGGQTSFAAIGFHSGQNAVTSITPLTNWTSRLEYDFGTQTSGWYTYNTVGSSDVTAGWTQTADDAVMIAVAVSEKNSTLATGSDPAPNTIAPGASATDVDQFTLQTNNGTESISSVTVNLSTNSGVGTLAITDNSNNILGSIGGGIGSGIVTGSNAISVSGMSATTTLMTFKVRATPLIPTAMPIPPGSSYTITAPVTSWAGTGGYTHAGSDTNPNALTIDNASPAGTTGLTATSGENGQSTVSWTNPADADFQQVYIYCKTSSVVSGEAPTEGTDPAAGSTCDGTARLRYKGTASPQTITGLGSGMTYYFRVYARDTRGNFTAYSATQEVSATTAALNTPPTLVIDNPPAGNTNVAEGANYSIQYDLSDPDSAATVNFYYDTNNDGVGGTAIAACQNQPEGTNATCSFSTSILSVNTVYYIYGVASDGVNPNVTTVSSGTITVNAAPTLTVTQPDGTGDTVNVGDSYNITYSLADTDNVVTAAMYYDTDAVGLNGTAISGACATAAEGSGVACSWNTTGMTPGSYYVYGITNDGVNPQVSDYSPGPITINAALPGTPGTPTFSNIGASSLRVNWTAASGADSYKVERCSGSGCTSFSQIASGVTTLYYDDSSLSSNATYRYQVRGTNAGGDGPYSGIGTTLTLPGIPGTPTFSNVGETSLTVNWTAPTGGAGSYKVERCQGSGCTSFSQIASGVTTLYYDDSSLSPDTTYRYQVRATNTSGDGAYSGIGSVTTSATPVITVSTTGTQTSSMIIPSTNQYVGGAFTLQRSASSTTVTQITITETGSVNANTNLSNAKVYYKTTGTCSYDGGESQFGTAVSFSSDKATFTGSMMVGTSQVCAYIILDVGSGAAGGDTLEIEISNPSTEVVASAGNVAPASAVAISGTTILNTIPVITVGTTGNQISPFIIPSSNNYVGGAFTLQRSAGSTTVTQITVTETGSVNAQTNLSNVKMYYETAGTCSFSGSESQFGATTSFNGSAKATFTGSITVDTSQVCAYVVLDVGSGATDGQTLEIEISNPSTEVVASAGNVAPASAVAISGTTTLLVKPSVTSVSPNNGKLAGGTNVTIMGSGFLSGASVTFGGTSATNIVVVSNTSITATTPAHSTGAVDIAVTNTNGQSGTLTGGYTYNPSPTISGVDPLAGPIGGNTDVTIAGTGFFSGATVTFGGSAATNVSVISGTSITAKTPAHLAGAVDVVIMNTDTQSGTLVNGFSYTAGPVITSISPDNGKLAGGANVAITGGNFQSGATITFGGVAATNIVFVSSTTITATTPAHAAGAVNVTVTNPDSQSHTLTGGYTYNPLPTVSSVNPSSGSTGGDNITITGTGFLSGASVTFGGTTAANIVVVSNTSITATTPAHAIGTVDVAVTNSDTQSGTLVNGFSYVGPPVVNLTANPTSIYSGELSVLNWTSTDASSCTASGAWSGSKATTGNEIVSPTSTSTYTLTCDGPGGSAQVSVTVTVSGEAPPPTTVGGAAGVQFYFGGLAYANGTVLIYDNGIPVARLTTGDNASFSTILRVYTTIKHVYGIVAYDREKQSSPVKTFPSDVYASRAAGEILMAPTINLNKRKLSKKEEINVYGYATPKKKVKIEIDGKTEADIAASETGYYNGIIKAEKFSDGSHKIRAKQIDETGKESDYSILKLFTIGEPFAANVDLNGDKILNISDWSIFLSCWASKKAEIRAKIDLNGDGKINISDLSIFLNAFSKKKK